MAVDTSRLRFGDLIAGGSAVLLFLFLFMRWFKVEEEGESVPDAFKDLATFNAWESFAFIDLLLFLICAVVIGIVVVRLLGVALPPLPVPLGTIILALGALAVLLILFRLIVTPNPAIEFGGVEVRAEDGDGEVKRAIGVFLGFLASLGILAGGFLSSRERGEAIPGVDGPLGGGQPAGGPLGTGQPVGGQPVGGQPVGGQPVGGQPVGGGGAGAASAGSADPGAQAGGQPKADWYPDPQGQARLRYWDGSQWTDQTAD